MTNSILRGPLQLALVAALALALLGCRSGSAAMTETTRRPFDEQGFANVKPGLAQDHVLALLGEPSSKVRKGGGRATWSWAYSEVREGGDRVLLVLPPGSREKPSGAVHVGFDLGKVVSIWRE